MPTASLTDLERQFSDRLRDSSLVGYFTVSGRTKREADEDRYDITSVEKVADDRWRFNVRMRHGSFDVTLPVVVPVKWVDDTPVVTLTDWEIPSLGTFTCRVLFHGDRYAGTWQHGPTGGLMYRQDREAGAAVASPADLVIAPSALYWPFRIQQFLQHSALSIISL